MSVPHPLWMQPPTLAPASRHVPRYPPGQEHLGWPWKLPIKDSVGFELEDILRRNQGKGCRLVKYVYKSDDSVWKFDTATTSLEKIKDMVTWTGPPNDWHDKERMFIMASSLQDEAVRSLGLWMGVPPTYFMLPDVRLRVVARDGIFLFTVQYMSKCDLSRDVSQAQRSAEKHHCRFKNCDGQQLHEWGVTQARLVFLTKCRRMSETGKHQYVTDDYISNRSWRGLYVFDQADSDMAFKLKNLLLAPERPDPDGRELHPGLGQVVQDVIYLISCNWLEFLNEADTHLQFMSKQCIADDLTSDQQLEYMRELHALLPLWTRVRRHLTALDSLIAQFLNDDMSRVNALTISHTDQYFVKTLQVVNDQLSRCSDLVTQTNNLISLIFNIATLQESRAAVEESKAANRFASSIQRVTVLTFVYLPLTLASSLLGMNVVQLTGEASNSQLWLFFVIAVALMGATFGAWLVWFQFQSHLERRKQRKDVVYAAKEKGA